MMRIGLAAFAVVVGVLFVASVGEAAEETTLASAARGPGRTRPTAIQE